MARTATRSSRAYIDHVFEVREGARGAIGEPRRRLRLQLRTRWQGAPVASHSPRCAAGAALRWRCRQRQRRPCCPRTAPTCSTTATRAAASRSTARRCWCARSSARSSRSSANYYVDMVSSASIDVVTTASPYDGRAQAEEPRARLPARQDALQRRLHQQRRERLHREHRELRPQPGHVRRPDHPVAGLRRGWDEVGKRGDPTFEEPWTAATTGSASRRSSRAPDAGPRPTRRSPTRAS